MICLVVTSERLNDVFTCVLRRSLSKTIDGLINATERTQHALVHAVMPLDSWGVKSELAQKVF